MPRKLFVALALISLIALTGCLTKPIAVVQTVATEMVHPDGPVATFFGYGPWSEEFKDSFAHFDSHRRTYLRDLNAIVRDWDRHFLNYDEADFFAE